MLRFSSAPARRRRRPRLLLRRRRRRPLLVPLVKLLLLLLLLLRAPLLYRRCRPHQRMRLLRSLMVPRLRVAIFLRLHIPICRRWRALVRLSPPIFSRLRPAILWLRSFRLVVDPWLRHSAFAGLDCCLGCCLVYSAVGCVNGRNPSCGCRSADSGSSSLAAPAYWTNQRC